MSVWFLGNFPCLPRFIWSFAFRNPVFNLASFVPFGTFLAMIYFLKTWCFLTFSVEFWNGPERLNACASLNHCKRGMGLRVHRREKVFFRHARVEKLDTPVVEPARLPTLLNPDDRVTGFLSEFVEEDLGYHRSFRFQSWCRPWKSPVPVRSLPAARLRHTRARRHRSLTVSLLHKRTKVQSTTARVKHFSHSILLIINQCRTDGSCQTRRGPNGPSAEPPLGPSSLTVYLLLRSYESDGWNLAEEILTVSMPDSK